MIDCKSLTVAKPLSSYRKDPKVRAGDYLRIRGTALKLRSNRTTTPSVDLQIGIASEDDDVSELVTV